MIKLRDEIASSDHDWMEWDAYVKVCQGCGIVDRAEQRMVRFKHNYFAECEVVPRRARI